MCDITRQIKPTRLAAVFFYLNSIYGMPEPEQPTLRLTRQITFALNELNTHTMLPRAYMRTITNNTSNDRTLKLWRPSTGELITTLQGHADVARAAVFSPDGSRVASVSYDRTLRLWDPETAETVLSFRAHLDWPSSVAWSR